MSEDEDINFDASSQQMRMFWLNPHKELNEKRE